MKKIYSLLTLLLVSCSVLWAQSDAPLFSAGGQLHYYKIKFKQNGRIIEDKGAEQLFALANAVPFGSKPSQLFAFEGDAEAFTLRTQEGRYVGVKNAMPKAGGAGDFIYSTSDKTQATTFQLRNNGTGYFNIVRKSDASSSFNQWAGTAAGNNIGFWADHNDRNNPLFFEAPELSTADALVYWQLQFKSSGRYLLNAGADKLISTGNRAGGQSLEFAFVGTKSDFKLLTKAGQYVGVKTAKATNGQTDELLYATTEANATAFAIVNAKDGTFEIGRKGNTGKTFNPWGGTSVSPNNIGFWNAGDGSNKLQLFAPTEPEEFDAATIKGATTFAKESNHTLWYDRPATVTGVENPWMEYSLPIGNGQLGASLFGGVKTDEIQFNEKTLWSGPVDAIVGNADYGYYLNFGSVKVVNTAKPGEKGTSATTDYVRYLDIEKGVAGVNFTDADGTRITRRYLSSQPDGVIAVHYKAEGVNKLNLRFFVQPGDELNASQPEYAADGSGAFGGKLQSIYHAARFKVVPTGGTMTTTGKGVEVSDASEVVLVLSGGTTFDSQAKTRSTGDLATVADRIKGIVDAAAAKQWSAIEEAHVKDFTALMGRVNLQIKEAASQKNTEELVKYYNASANNKSTSDGLFLEQLYFNYGRYLSISSSRGVDVPNNLQGIWNDKARAPWHADIHTNINVQMNYWSTEPTNLSECHEPFLNFIINNAKSDGWKKAATQYGKAKDPDAWTCFTETNIFGGMSTWGNNYFVANAWYASHLWQHYRYTLDKDYLKRAFPAMWSSAKFWMDRMIKDRKVNDGTWVCPDEYSPEQNDHPKEDATAHAQQLVMDNLQNCMQAIEALGREALGLSETDVERLQKYLNETDKGLATETYKGNWGDWATNNGIKTGDKLIREWKYTDYDVSTDKGHRHISHLMCLYPLNQVQQGDEYFEAAVNSLKLRGDAATGWSMGWKVNLWARAKDGNHARVILKNALKHSTSYGTNAGAGGIYYNLYDSHAPFQIDGNFGVCSGISEMLMQSQNDVIELLPALPTEWSDGHIKGLKAVGNFTVNISWKGGKATQVEITSHKGQPLRVKSAEDLTKVQVQVAGKDATVKQEASGAYLIEGVGEGQTVSVDFSKPTGIHTPFRGIASSNAQAPIYDLSGRRAAKPAHGVYLQAGKKVMQ